MGLFLHQAQKNEEKQLSDLALLESAKHSQVSECSHVYVYAGGTGAGRRRGMGKGGGREEEEEVKVSSVKGYERMRLAE